MARHTGVWVLGALIILASPAALAADPPQLNPSGFTSSQVCGSCHQDIYAMWKDSKHARAFENPIFAAAYRDLQREGGNARRLCLRCHAPIAGITGDLEAQQAITREGVTCDFCHSVAGVAIRDTDSPFVVEVGPTKRGPKVGASSAAHPVQPSILHKSSRLCGGCHEFRNPEGLTTISTYSEWRGSSYPAELRACQDCHFLPVNGRSAIQIGTSAGSKVPDHRLQRSQEQLLDGGGRFLVRDAELLRARNLSGNRIGPHEVRTETVTFPVPSREAVRVRAELEYVYRSHILAGNEWRVEVARQETVIPAQ